MFSPIFQGLRNFTVIGAIGFTVDASILSTLVHAAGWSPWQARFPSFAVAVFVTWILNRQLTFRGRGMRQGPVELLFYGTIQAFGAGINLLTFGVCLPLSPWFAAYPVLPFAIGSAAALLFNFVALNRFVYSLPSGANE